MAGTAIVGYSPVADVWYPSIVYPYPKVYHRFLNKKTFEEIYPEVIINNTETNQNTTTSDVDDDVDLSGVDEEI